MAEDDYVSLTAKMHAIAEPLRFDLAMLDTLISVHTEQKSDLQMDPNIVEMLEAYIKHLFEARSIGKEIISYIKKEY